MLKVPLRPLCRRWVLRWRCNLRSCSLVRTMLDAIYQYLNFDRIEEYAEVAAASPA